MSGTTGNDTFNGVLQANGATGTTIQPGDAVNGGAGTDSLNITVAGDIGGGNNAGFTIAAVQTSGVEKVLLSNFNTRDHADAKVTVAAGLMTGLAAVGMSSSSSTGDTVFNGMQNMVAAEMRNGAGDLTLTYDGAQVVTGTSDSQALTVSNLTGGTFTANGIETLNITSEIAKSTLTAAASNALKSVVITGAADLSVTTALVFAATANSTTVEGTVDASSFTGKLSIDASGSASTVNVKGGSGNDTIKMAATLTVNDVIDGGAGSDTVEITAHDGATPLVMKDLKLTSVETFQITGTSNKDTVVNADASTVAKFVAVENATTTKDVTFTNLAGGTTIALNSTVDGQAFGAVALSLKDPAGTSDILNIEVNATSGQGSEIVTSITANDIETINLSSGFVGTTAALATDINTVTNATFGAATKMTITGDTNLTFSNAMTASKLKTVDASALTGKLVYVANAVDLDLKSGTKDDTLTFGTTLTIADKVDGGAGKDTLTATINALGTKAAPAALSIANVETISLTATTADSFIDAAGITGAEVINIGDANSAASVAVTLSNLASGVKIGLGGLATDKEFKGTVDLTLADATGAADSVTFVLADTDSDNDVAATLKVAAAVENVTIEANTDATANDASFTLTDVKSAKVTVTKGNATEVIALGTLSTTTTTVDASTFDGLLSVTGSASADTMTVKKGASGNTIDLGAGNDVLTILDLGADDAAGGTGEDTLNATIKGSVTEATTGFETINYTIGNNIQSTVTAANSAGVDVAKVFNLLGGDALTTFAHDLVSPAALTTYNMGGFTGKSTALTVAATAVDLSAVTLTGSAGDDTVTVTTNNSNFAVKAMTGVETLVINAAGGATTFDASKTSGIKTVKVDDDNTARVITLADLTTGTDVEITTGITATNVVIDLLDKTAAANSVKVTVGTTVGTVNIDADEVETVNLVNTTGASTVDLAGLAITEADKFITLNVTGNQALTINALNADVNVIDASGMTTGGSVVQTGRSGTTAATYTGTAGDDTFIMGNLADVIAAGEGSDTLDINVTAVLGGIVVDLSATDVVVQANGSLNTTVQSGFINVDLAGYAGGYGAVVTANKAGSTITGTAATDQITGGAGADVINVATAGAANNDVMDGGAGANKLVLQAGSNTFAVDSNLVNIQTIELGEAAEVNLTNQTEGFTINGGTGANVIEGGAGNDIITGGDGIDTIDLTNGGSDTIKFAATGATNDDDAISGFATGATADGGDVFDFTAFIATATVQNSLTSSIYNAITAAKSLVLDANLLTAGSLANKIVILKGTVSAYDEAAEIADLFDVSADSNGTLAGSLAVGGKAIVIVGANDGTELSIAYVHNAATAGIADSEVVIVGSITGATADAIDKLIAANFAL